MEKIGSLAKRYWPYLLIIFVSGLFRAIRLSNPLNWRSSPYPMGYNGVDEGIHLMAARLAGSGFKMYVDVNAQQGPLFMFVYQILGGDPFSIRVLSVILSLIGILVVMVIAEKMNGRSVAVVAGLFLGANFIFLKESRHASVDLYASVLLVIAFLLLMMYYEHLDKSVAKEERKNWPMRFYLVLSGVFFALALQTKLYAIIPFAGVGIYLVVLWVIRMRKGKENTSAALMDIVILGISAGVVALAIMFIYGFEETFQGVFLDNLHRPGMPLEVKLTVVSRFLFYTSIPLIFAAIGVIRHYRERNVHFLLIWAVPLTLLFIFQGLSWVHYFVMVIPPISILAAYGVKSLLILGPEEETKPKRKEKRTSEKGEPGPDPTFSTFRPSPRNITVLSLAALFVVFFTCFNAVLLYDAEKPIEYEIADEVAALSEEGDYVISGDPIISIYADRDQPPDATNLAAVRYPALDSYDLINITCEYQVQVVVFTFHLSSYDRYLDFILNYYTFHKAYDRSGETTWTNDAPPTDQSFFLVFYLPEGTNLEYCRQEFILGSDIINWFYGI